MAQYEVFRLPDGRLIVDMQASYLSSLPTRMAAPLVPTDKGPTPLSHLEPVFVVDGVLCALHIGEMAAIPRGLLPGRLSQRWPQRPIASPRPSTFC